MEERFLKDRVLFNSTDEVDEFITRYGESLTRKSWNFVFLNPFIKAYCFDELCDKFGYEVINCDTTLIRFCALISESSDNIIFDCIDYCNNQDILDILENNKGIFVSSILI